jgi:acetyl/propionyl-CoA carboxylase alpha subunit
LYTSDDASHCFNATHAISLPSPSSYLDVSKLVAIVRGHGIDAVHPGYGFLSESAEFAKAMWDEANAIVIGPGWEILARTGDKLQARILAQQCLAPVLPVLQIPTDRVEYVQKFAVEVGYPIMIKAVDGGGGRGIRIFVKRAT